MAPVDQITVVPPAQARLLGTVAPLLGKTAMTLLLLTRLSRLLSLL